MRSAIPQGDAKRDPPRGRKRDRAWARRRARPCWPRSCLPIRTTPPSSSPVRDRRRSAWAEIWLRRMLPPGRSLPRPTRSSGSRSPSSAGKAPAEELNDTAVTQPALLTHSVAVLRAMAARRPGLTPAVVAGHSLGEFSALVSAAALDFAPALRLVQQRGLLMKEAGQRSPGGMAAVLGLEVEQIDTICRAVEAESGGVVQVANDNCPGQVVISGDEAALATAMKRLAAAGAKRTIRLAVSIAAHSALMAPANPTFGQLVDEAGVRDPRPP